MELKHYCCRTKGHMWEKEHSARLSKLEGKRELFDCRQCLATKLVFTRMLEDGTYESKEFVSDPYGCHLHGHEHYKHVE